MVASTAERSVIRVDSDPKNKHQEQSTTAQTLGFDLGLELRYIHQTEQPVGEKTVLETKEERFAQSAKTYINEALHVGLAKYDPFNIKRGDDDEVTLTTDNYGEVSELFNPDNPETKDKWPLYRKTEYNYKRAKIEYECFKLLEKSLKNAKPGDSYIWISPPPYDLVLSDKNDEEKKKELADKGFGFHTNTFLFTVEDDHILQGRVIQNYLRPEDQRELLKVLLDQDIFKETPTEMELLSVIAKLPQKNIVASDIKSVIDLLYAHTPDKLKIKPTAEYEKQLWSSEEKMNEIHYYMRPFLTYVFHLLRHVDEQELFSDSELQTFIEMRFHIWEETVKNLHEGHEINLGGIQQILHLNNSELEILARKEIEVIRHRRFRDETVGTSSENLNDTSKLLNIYAAKLHNQKRSEPTTGCGIGSGFSMETASTLNILTEQSLGILPTNYIGAEILMARSLGIVIRHENYKCPNCPEIIPGEVIGSHPSTWTPRCPHCNFEFRCATGNTSYTN